MTPAPAHVPVSLPADLGAATEEVVHPPIA